jgi:hypothetical protein
MGCTFNGVAANHVDLLSNRDFLRNVSGGTLMFWATLSALGVARSAISISIGTGTATRAKMSSSVGNGMDLRIRVLDADVASSVITTPGGELNTTDRFHVAGVINFSNTTGIIYINGVQITTGVFTGLTAGNTSNTAAQIATIGANETGSSAPWFGDLEDVRVYGRILGAGEIASIYTARGSDGIVDSLQGRWPLNDGAQGTNSAVLSDLSINQYSGVAAGTVPFAGSTLRMARYKKITGSP